jgi:hypothetical protein
MEELCVYGCGRPGIVKNKTNTRSRCASSPNSCPAVDARKKQARLERYGTAHISNIPGVMEAKKKTWIEKYGVDNPSKSKVIVDKIRGKWENTKEKRKKTWMEKYGVENYSSTDEFKEKRKKTWMEKYGVDNPTKNSEILHKSMLSNAKSEYRTKTMTLPSGKIIRYQGYENQVVTDLLESGVTENDIMIGTGNVPVIKYMFQGKSRRYYPDIYLPKQNKLIEVKSTYTWNKYKEQNEAKIAAAKQAGYEVEVVLKDKKRK